MSRRKLNERSIRKLFKIGKISLAVILPIEIIRKLKWRAGQKIVVKKSGKKIGIFDWQPKKIKKLKANSKRDE